tara:strand:- start:1660 stop:5226 length:3567 start_codon:yes stop_codon:yes gene_type:complete
VTVETPLPRPEGLVSQRKYTQGQGPGDIELRAELEPFMYGNPLARLGYELYKEGKIDIKAMDNMARGGYGMHVPPSMAKAMGFDKPTVTYLSTPGLTEYDKRRIPYGPSEYFENMAQELDVDPRRILVHELTHAAFDVLEKELGEKSGVEEAIVRAGDELITGRTTGESGTRGGPGLKNLLQGSNIPLTPKNERILKERYLKHSLQAQDILNKKGIPPEAIAPSDNRNPGRLSKFFKELLGFEQERNKLNYLGFARPLEDTVLGLPTKEQGALYTKDVNYLGGDAIKKGTLDPSRAGVIGEGPSYLAKNVPISTIMRRNKRGGALMAKTGLMPLTEATSNPTGNKRTKPPKIPRAAATKVVDPRDEALKLVAKKLKEDKTQIGIPQPVAPTPVVSAQQPMMTAGLAAPMMPQQEMTTMKEGGTKSKKGKGLAVVIGMSGAQPEYEEASKGTPADPPPGATSAEVKDDQHVLLSEGELVVPANVVRYHGLGMYEGLRREALQGLGEMEDAGQVDYVDNDIKSAQAGMTIMNAPNVATSQGIATQQAQFRPTTTPEAASAQFVSTGFVDRNRDGIDDKLQPSVKKTPVTTAPTSFVTPAGLRLGPTTDATTVVGAGNVGSYVGQQRGVPGDDKAKTPPPADPAPVSPAKVVQQDVGGDDGGDPEIAAGLGGARATIGGQEYAIQYDFNGNITGIANVADALSTGRANFFAPNPELSADLANMTKGQINLLSGGLYGNISKEGKINREQTVALAQKIKEGNYGGLGMRPQDMPMPRPAGLGTSTMPRVETAPVATVDRQTLPSTAPIAPVSKQLAFGLGENLGGAFGTNVTDYGLSIDPTTGRPSVQAPKLDITNVANMGIDGPADAADTVSRMGIDGAATTPFQPGFDYSDDMLPDRPQQPQQPIFGGGIDGPADAAASRVGVDGPADAEALRQSRALFDRQAELDRTAGTTGFQSISDEEADIAGAGLGRKEQRETSAPEAPPTRAEAASSYVSDNFSISGQEDVNARGGSVGIGRNDSGTTYSENRDGSFTHEDGTTVNFTDSSGKPGNAPTQEEAREQRMSDRTAKYDDPTDDSATSGDSKIVCTEMYRQTQLDDWAQAMKTWYIYQKKYLTPIHEVGYHWLFKPFVRGMKVNNVLTNIGAYFATERTKHLRHVLTKGKSKDSLVGNIFCKIIHPIVYLVGLAVHKK